MKEYDFIDIKVSRRLDAAIDVTKLTEWVDTDCVIRAGETVKKVTPGIGRHLRFNIGGEIRAVWDRAQSAKARIAIAREAIEARLGSAGAPFVIENLELFAFSEEVSSKYNFAIHVTPQASGVAWPKIRSERLERTIDLATDTKQPETWAMRVEFEPPDFPRLARPPSSMRFSASVRDSAGAEAPDLLGALRLQLLKLSDQPLFQPITDGVARFDLDYVEKDLRVVPQGLLFAFDSRALIDAARAGRRRFTLTVRFSLEGGASAGACEVALTLAGDLRDRLLIGWSTLGRARDLAPLYLEGAANSVIALEDVECELLDDGAPITVDPRLSVKVEPADARIDVRARLGGENFGALKATPGHSGAGDWSFPVPLGSWLAALARQRALAFPEPLEFELGFEQRGENKRGTATLRARVTRADARPSWVACIDFGASTTAIWLGRAQGEQRGRPLALGAWLETIDRGSPANDGDDETLLPSYVGLSSDFHLRALFDPLSLGDLTLALPGRDAAARRLAALGYSYDVSVPFPSRAVMRRRFADNAAPAFVRAIVPELKRSLVRNAAPLDLHASVLRREGTRVEDVDKVDLAGLMQDVFAALGGYVAPRVLGRDMSAESRSDLRDIAAARLEGRPFLIVVTHPYGVRGALAQTYQRAAQRFAESFTPAGDGERAGHRIALVPEALAAAQFGIETLPQGAAGPDEIVDYLTFDVGAGTFDASLISDRPDAPFWSVAQHFGVALGGADIDGALLDLVIEILLEADVSGLRTGFVLREGFAAPDAPERRVLARQLQSAKARLNAELRQRGGVYEWRDEELSLCVGVLRDPEGDVAWPVAFRAEVAAREPIRGDGWTLSVENSSVHSRELRLDIQRACLEAGRQSARALNDITRALGKELPEMALSLASPDRRKVVIVTGRAALWPPLHALIRESAEAFSARLSSDQPLSPREMKEAVVRGAVSLATKPAQISEAERPLFNPLAMLTYSTAERGRDGFTRNRVIREITLLPEPGAKEILVDITQTFVIASVIPGLARAGLPERLALFERIHERHQVRPYTVLSADIEPLRHVGAGRHWVSAAAVEARVELKFRPADAEGEERVISVLREGRFYG